MRSSRCRRNPQIEILGNPDIERLGSWRSASEHPAGLLHANFVVAVLSDLFGIQARSGCFCAGPYIHRMYPIDDDWSFMMTMVSLPWSYCAAAHAPSLARERT